MPGGQDQGGEEQPGAQVEPAALAHGAGARAVHALQAGELRAAVSADTLLRMAVPLPCDTHMLPAGWGVGGLCLHSPRAFQLALAIENMLFSSVFQTWLFVCMGREQVYLGLSSLSWYTTLPAGTGFPDAAPGLLRLGCSQRRGESNTKNSPFGRSVFLFQCRLSGLEAVGVFSLCRRCCCCYML